MATPKKKHLVELMIEEGIEWHKGAEYAAQDKRDGKVYFFSRKPSALARDNYYSAPGGPIGYSHLLPSLCRNWHQTIVTREQYAEALAANVGEPAVMPHKSNQVRESNDVPAVDSAEWHNQPSIEQLTADYHAKAAEADRLQSVADEALKAADDALIALEKAGELIGLVISIDTKPKQPAQPEQPEITDWRDLRVGDVVECVDYDYDKYGVIVEIYNDDEKQPIKVERGENRTTSWPSSWRFIRRP